MTVPPDPTLARPPWRKMLAAVLEVSSVRVPVEERYIGPLVVDSVMKDRGEVRLTRVKAPDSVDKVAVPNDPDSVPLPVCRLKLVLLAEVSRMQLPVDRRVRVLADKVVG